MKESKIVTDTSRGAICARWGWRLLALCLAFAGAAHAEAGGADSADTGSDTLVQIPESLATRGTWSVYDEASNTWRELDTKSTRSVTLSETQYLDFGTDQVLPLDDMEALAELPRLAGLEMMVTRDTGWKVFPRLQDLKNLTLHGRRPWHRHGSVPEAAADEAIQYFTQAPMLKHVTMWSLPPFGVKSWQGLLSMKELRTLWVVDGSYNLKMRGPSSFGITDSSLELESLSISFKYTDFMDHDLMLLTQGSRLTHVAVSDMNHMTVEGLEHLLGIDSLRSVELARVRCSMVPWSEVGSLPPLEHVSFFDVPDFSVGTAKALAAVPSLTSLELSRLNLSPEVVEELGSATSLQHLELRSVNRRSESPGLDLSPLLSLPKLESLVLRDLPWLDGIQFTGHTRLPALAALKLIECGTGEARPDLKWIADLHETLTSLTLQLNLLILDGDPDPIDEALIATLLELLNLERLDVSYNSTLTSKHVIRLVEGLPNLKYVDLTGTDVSEETRRALRKQYPELNIEE
jgi:hypothetical protein